MLILITYDVNTATKEGRKRLSRMARQCVNYATRVQNSVFECVADYAKFREIKQKLVDIIDPEVDSLRFYYLGDHYKTKVEHIGAKSTICVENTLVF